MAVTQRTRRAGVAAVLALVIGGGGFAAGAATAGPATVGPATAGPEASSRPPAAAAARSGAASYADVVRQVLPSVVLIRTASGLGSGVVLDGQGNIVTNAHQYG
jgi:putative serine protease PepD